MKQLVLFIAFGIVGTTAVSAQEQPNTFVFEGNNFRWTQNPTGSLFHDQNNGLPGMEVPIGLNTHSIFASALWLAGVNPSGNLKISFRRFCQSDNENCIENWGPLKLNGDLSTPEEVADFNKVWFITGEQIDLHIQYFDCFLDPDCDENLEFPNYQVPPDMITWPAEGQEGYAPNLAPFHDRDGNGIYTPQNGDYPAICGDFSSYTIWNDLGTETIEQVGIEVGVEVHTTVYGFNSIGDAQFNTLFVKHKLIHRGTSDALSLTDTYLGCWNDFDLGNPTDDFVATDVERSMIYAYNADDLDDSSETFSGYGSNLAVIGLKILSGVTADPDGIDGSLDQGFNEPFYGNQTSGYNDGIIDNERLGLASSITFNNTEGPAATQDPQVGIEYYNYMRGIWRDNTPMTFGSTGYQPGNPEVLHAEYIFPGDSDPLLVGTQGVDPNYETDGGWTEQNEGNSGGDRRMLGTSGPFTFAPGDVQYIDLAYIFARESFDDEETVIETLQRFADEVEGMQCEPLPAIVLSTDRAEERKPLKVFPNPSSGSISFELNENAAQLTMIDITGKVVRQEILNSGLQRIDVSDLADGIYMIQVQADQSIYHGKVVVDK